MCIYLHACTPIIMQSVSIKKKMIKIKVNYVLGIGENFGPTAQHIRKAVESSIYS